MPYELKEGQGSLFRVKERKSDRHPSMSGTLKIGGKEYFVDAWTKETRDGDKWLSLSAKEKKGKPTARDDDAPPF